MIDNSNTNRTFAAVPADIARSWIKGEYIIGASESTGYEFIGWALLLRGMYVYEVHVPKPNGENTFPNEFEISHWGLCTIDIKEGDFTYQGIRLYSNPRVFPFADSTHSDHNACENRIRLWQSEFSKISRGGGNPHAYFGYVMFDKDEKTEADDAASARFLAAVGIEETHWKDLKLATPPTSLHSKTLCGATPDNKKCMAAILNKGREFLNSDLDKLLIANRPHKNEQIVSIIHIKLDNLKQHGAEILNVVSEYQLVNSVAAKRVAPSSGCIVWTPIQTSLNDFQSIVSDGGSSK